jgi:NAD(P)-dependent dehydrogenase (short-subunit alcohol dehydrogenase family)
MSLVALFKPNGPSGFGHGTTADQATEGVDLKGKRILLTGCNSGIGLESMRVLVARGATVVAAARTEEKAQEAGASVGGETIPVACELSDPESVLACVDTVKRQGKKLDIMILNAGIMALPKLQTSHGLELQFLTNHVGHFLLGTRLIGMLSDDARVVVLSSRAHEMTPEGGIAFDNLDGSKGYNGWKFYGQSKLANLLFARELAKRFAGSKRTANAVHPGVIHTNLGRHMGGAVNVVSSAVGPLFFKSVPQGAATQCWAAAYPDAGKLNGKYLADCNEKESSPAGKDMGLAERLWEETERIVAKWER